MTVATGSTLSPKTVTAVGPVRVWIIPPSHVNPSGYAFDWPTASELSFAAQWVEEPRLLPQTSSRVAGSTGSASFRLLRRLREENGVAVNSAGNVIRGAYIAITVGIQQAANAAGGLQPAVFDATKVRWWGWITSIDCDRVQGTVDEIGVVQAQELGGLLDGTQLSGWRQKAGDGSYPVAINVPPTANINVADGIVVGNCVGETDTDASDAVDGKWPVFARLPAECGNTAGLLSAGGNYWTRYRLLQHITRYCKPAGMPSFKLNIPSGVLAFLDDTTWKEVFDLPGLTLKGAIDMLLPRSRGVGWFVRPYAADHTLWEIVAYSHDPGTTTADTYLKVGSTLANNVAVDVTLTSAIDCVGVSTSSSSADEYDQVVIRGEPIVAAATVGVPDGNLGAGWTGASTTGGTGTAGLQEALYRNGCRTGASYPAGVTTQGAKIARNTQRRQSGSLERVFTCYALQTYTNGFVERKSPGGTGAGTAKALVPTLLWNGDTSTISVTDTPASNRQPYLPTARILGWLPWPRDIDPDGTDRRDAQLKAQPEYLTPRLFKYETVSRAFDVEAWTDLIQHGDPNDDSGHPQRGTPAVSSDDRSFALRVVYSPPEIMAYGHWTTGTDAVCGLDPLDPTTSHLSFDWKRLVATIAVESSQRVEVSRNRPGISDARVRRQLVIEHPRLKCWIVPKDTILRLTPASPCAPDRAADTIGTFNGAGLDATGQASYILTRNDFPAAQKLCDMVSAWVFRPRVSVSIRLARPDQTPSWAELGTMIGAVYESADGTTATSTGTLSNTVVEAVEYNWQRGASAGITVSTAIIERPELPHFGGAAASSSPSAGGAVSASLGGTVAQATVQLQRAVVDLQRETQKLPIHPPRVLGSAAASVKRLLIDRGNTLATGQLGVKYSASTITNVPTAYDATVDTSFITGVGRAYYYIDGVSQGLVLVVNDGGGGSAINFDLLGDTDPDVGSPVAATVSLTVGGDPNTTVTAYRIDSLVG